METEHVERSNMLVVYCANILATQTHTCMNTYGVIRHASLRQNFNTTYWNVRYFDNNA